MGDAAPIAPTRLRNRWRAILPRRFPPPSGVRVVTRAQVRDAAESSPSREPMRPRRGVRKMRGATSYRPMRRDHSPTHYPRPRG